MDKELLAHLGFSHFLGIGPVRFNGLIARFHSADAAYNASLHELKQILDEKTAAKFNEYRKEKDLEKLWMEIKRKEIRVVTRDSVYYPESFKHLTDAPICLYVKGDIERFDFNEGIFVGMVGTRIPTSYGRTIAQQFAFELTRAGCIIVSGMALGIDTVAHTAALDAGGKTVAFLGCGVDIVYPPANQPLYNRIIENSGLVISEFPPGQTVLRGLFVARNRLISGLSQGVMVVEGTGKSGALITARYAGEQGKELFAPPAPITSAQSEAPNLLLKEGAKLVTTPGDILEEFSLIFSEKKIVVLVSEREKPVYNLLKNESLTADDICTALHMGIAELSTILTQMEVIGIVEKGDDERYFLRN